MLQIVAQRRRHRDIAARARRDRARRAQVQRHCKQRVAQVEEALDLRPRHQLPENVRAARPVQVRHQTRRAGKRKRGQIVRPRRERQRRCAVHFRRQARVRTRRPRRRQRRLVEIQCHRRGRRRHRAVIDRDRLCRRRGVAVTVRDLVGEARANARGIVQVGVRIERPGPVRLEGVDSVRRRELEHAAAKVRPGRDRNQPGPKVHAGHRRAVRALRVVRQQIGARRSAVGLDHRQGRSRRSRRYVIDDGDIDRRCGRVAVDVRHSHGQAFEQGIVALHRRVLLVVKKRIAVAHRGAIEPGDRESVAGGGRERGRREHAVRYDGMTIDHQIV